MGVVLRNLYDVKGRWKFRKVIPVALRQHTDGNLTEFVRWLGSGPLNSPQLAAKYAAAALECDKLLALAKKRSEGMHDDLTDALISFIVESARSEMLEDDEDDRFDDEADALFDSIKDQLRHIPGALANPDHDRRWTKRQDTLEWFLEHRQRQFARGKIDADLKAELEERCAALGLNVDLKGKALGTLGRAYLVMEIEVTEAALQRQQGRVIPTPAAPTPQSPAEISRSGLTLREMAGKKLEMNGKSHATTEATETALRLFESLYGSRPMATITRREVADWIFALQKKPIRPALEHRAFGLKELVEAYEGKTVRRLSGKSINGHVGHLNSVWTWARKRGFVDRSLDNPFSEQRVDEVAPQADEGFTSAQLQAIFKTPVFVSGERPKGGRGEAAFWVPLLLLTYGTRPEEMCQLLVSDIFKDAESDLWCLRITDEGLHPVKGARHIKADGNALVRRTLPVAQRLLELGFVDYVDGLRDAGETALFPLLTTKGKRGYLHASFATWWGEYLREHEAIPPTGNKPLRDFRDTWTTAASASGLTEEERQWIQGHYYSKAKTSNRKYGVREFGKRIEDVVFRGLDLSGVAAANY